MTEKERLRRLYPPLGDGGGAARRVIALWESQGLPDSVFCYVSGPDECSTAPILCYCLKNGISLAVPLCKGGGIMTARLISDFSFLRRGRYGIMEPCADAEVLDAPEVVIVPGLLFDRKGYRIGRGGGYYDRFLKEETNSRTIGLCRPERLVHELPREPWDAAVDRVITG